MKFVNGDKVTFHSTSDTELDSLTGTVVGVIAEHPEVTMYIVMLHKRHSKWNWDAMGMTEHCLNRL